MQVRGFYCAANEDSGVMQGVEFVGVEITYLPQGVKGGIIIDPPTHFL
jgi:hypothetical protein